MYYQHNLIYENLEGAETESSKSYILHTGQLIAYELVHASQARCPVELVNIPVPKDDPDFSSSTYGSEMPFVRSGYNKKLVNHQIILENQ